ncbi:hypothetical protein M3Y96_00160300 [Aphelenchoides besseyi]|nr:hypothetical protein M3Y96_00160300 [Aphelenchoides besseyi]
MAFEGKVVVITGSSFGIGRGIALAFGREGASVTIHGRSVSGLKDCKKFLIENQIPAERILKVIGAAEDEDVQRTLINETIQKFGRLDVLVNNAGCYHKSGLDTAIESLENFDYVFNLNVRAPVALMQLAAPHLAKTQGNIVNISTAAADMNTSQISFYVASKHAQNSLTKSFAVRFAKDGIRVNSVSPGIIDDTRILKNSDSPDARAAASLYFHYISDYVTPFKRPGYSKNVAAVVLFLASPSAEYVTGANYHVDGGCSASLPPIDPREYPLHLVPTELLQKAIDNRKPETQ